MKPNITYDFFIAVKPAGATEAGVREWWIGMRKDREILTVIGPFATLQKARHEIEERLTPSHS